MVVVVVVMMGGGVTGLGLGYDGDGGGDCSSAEMTVMGLRNATMTLPSLRPMIMPWSGSMGPGSSTNLTMGDPSGVKPRNLAAISASSFSLSSARMVCL